jgi:phosphate transport system protein
MSRAALDIVSAAREAIVTTDATAALELDRADDEMDRLHDGLYRELLDRSWPHGTAAAVRVALIARYFERYADHATAVARQVAFVAGRSGLDTSLGVAPPG